MITAKNSAQSVILASQYSSITFSQTALSHKTQRRQTEGIETKKYFTNLKHNLPHCPILCFLFPPPKKNPKNCFSILNNSNRRSNNSYAGISNYDAETLTAFFNFCLSSTGLKRNPSSLPRLVLGKHVGPGSRRRVEVCWE